MSQNIILLILLFATIVGAIMVAVSVIIRITPKTLYFTLMSLAVFFYLLGYLFEINAKSMDSLMMSVYIEYLGIPYLATFAFLFIMDHCNKPVNKLRYLIPLFTYSILTQVLVYTNHLHHLYYKSVTFAIDGKLSIINIQGGFFYKFYFIHEYILIVASLIVLIRHYVKGSELFKEQSKYLIIAFCFPFVFSLIYFARITPYGIDITPISMFISNILYGYAIIKKGMFRKLPIAKASIIEEMRDGYLLFDNKFRYISANKKAIEIFPSLEKAEEGANISDIECLPNEFTIKDYSDKYIEFKLDSDDIKYYRATRSYVKIEGYLAFISFMVFDITELKLLMNNLESLATYDSLTDILNRSAFFKLAELEFDRIKLNNLNAVFFMVDIDFFKKVNDTYGHLCGDKVLKEIAKRLSDKFRKGDLFARYGGEEMCAFLLDVTLEDAELIAEVLRRTIEETPFTWEGKEFTVTVSIGIAKYDSIRHDALKAVIADADYSLYKAKANGRNQVSVFHVAE